MQQPNNHVPLEAVRKTLVEIDTNALDIFKDTDLTPSWQQAFRSGRLKDPGYNRICTLVGWLAQHHADALQRHVDTVRGEC